MRWPGWGWGVWGLCLMMNSSTVQRNMMRGVYRAGAGRRDDSAGGTQTRLDAQRVSGSNTRQRLRGDRLAWINFPVHSIQYQKNPRIRKPGFTLQNSNLAMAISPEVRTFSITLAY
jgi:hypothetical protein